MAKAKKGKGESAGKPSRVGTGGTPYARRDGTETRQTAIHLPVDVHRELRIRAIEENRTMSAVLTQAAREYLARHKPPRG